MNRYDAAVELIRQLDHIRELLNANLPITETDRDGVWDATRRWDRLRKISPGRIPEQRSGQERMEEHLFERLGRWNP